MNNPFYSYKPLPCRKVVRALCNLGLVECARKGTSHRQFRKIINGHLFKVTLDCHWGEVSANNIRSMIKQAGVSKSEFYEAADK